MITKKKVAAPKQEQKKPEGVLIATKLPEMEWNGKLSNSARSTFLNCRKKFQWQYLYRLSPRKPSIPFLIGGLFHNGLEQMYKNGFFDRDKTEQEVVVACEKACAESMLTPEESDKIWIQQGMIMGMLGGYEKLYLEKDLKEWEVVETERQFTYKISETQEAVGKRDMVVKVKKTGKIRLVEHKTAGRVDAGYIAKLPLDNQILGYANSLKKQMGKLPSDIVYNIVKKSALRLSQKETFAQFKKRVESEYLVNPSVYFYREVVSFTDKDVANYEAELKRFSEELLRAIKEKYFYMNTGQCTIMGTCPYMGLCINGPTQDALSRYRIRAAMHEELEDVQPE